MFQLFRLEDTVILEPVDLNAVKSNIFARIQTRYLNKVLPGHGLVIMVKESDMKVVDKVVIHCEGSVQALV